MHRQFLILATLLTAVVSAAFPAVSTARWSSTAVVVEQHTTPETGAFACTHQESGQGSPTVLVHNCEVPRRLPLHGEKNGTGMIDRGDGTGQLREYGPDGRAKYDLDFGHDHGYGDPHGHRWEYGPDGTPTRIPERL